MKFSYRPMPSFRGRSLPAWSGVLEGSIKTSDSSGTRWCQWTEKAQKVGSAGPGLLSTSCWTERTIRSRVSTTQQQHTLQSSAMWVVSCSLTRAHSEFRSTFVMTKHPVIKIAEGLWEITSLGCNTTLSLLHSFAHLTCNMTPYTCT